MGLSKKQFLKDSLLDLVSVRKERIHCKPLATYRFIHIDNTYGSKVLGPLQIRPSTF